VVGRLGPLGNGHKVFFLVVEASSRPQSWRRPIYNC
jgi:hypothetical protein